jgi:hypothetical protein
LVFLIAVQPGLCAEKEGPRPRAIRKAVKKALPLLLKGAQGHIEQRTCFACHNQGVPMLALSTARDRGFEVEGDQLKQQVDFILRFIDSNIQRFKEGKGTGGQVDTAGYALLALEQGGCEPNESTAAVAHYLLVYQKERDFWRTGSNRPPSEASHFVPTYLALRGLKTFGTKEQKEQIDKRFDTVKGWLVKAKATDTEDAVFRLWGLHTVGADRAEVQKAVDELVKLQRDDGGWGQLPAMDTDAYATATALVSLHMAGGMSTKDPVYRRGLAFLLKTQLKDGSWYVKSRSKPFQTYYESGFPHGKDQFISMTASAWATTALALACDPVK